MERYQFLWLDENCQFCKYVAELESLIFSDPWSENGIAETLKNPQGAILVVKQEEAIIGYVIIYHVLDECEIARIAVLPEMRRKKVGHQLMESIISWCESKEINRILLDVRESNIGAIAYYENEGFLTDGVRKNFYDAPKENAVLMSKNLK